MAGECDRCPIKGDCCKFMIFELANPMSADAIHWAELHPGVHIVNDGEGWFIRLDIPCGALTSDGLCSLHGTSEKPRTCTGWPQDGLMLLAERYGGKLDECIYAVEAAEAWALTPEGQGAMLFELTNEAIAKAEGDANVQHTES